MKDAIIIMSLEADQKKRVPERIGTYDLFISTKGDLSTELHESRDYGE